ncbi:hypothetical protein NKG94_11040 [Micromonospora sp. M12]
MDRTERERQAAQRRYLGWGLAFEPTMPGVDLARDVVFDDGPNGRCWPSSPAPTTWPRASRWR